MIMLSVLTSPRKGADYLSETVKALDDALAGSYCDEKWIARDGDLGYDLDLYRVRGWRALASDGHRTGQRLAMWRVFRLAQERKADWLVYCEDDIAVAPGLFARINEVTCDRRFPRGLPSDVAFLSFYDGRVLPEGSPAGVYYAPTMASDSDYFCGSLCMLIPRMTIDFLCKADPLDCPPFEGSFHSGDCVMGYHLARSPWPSYGIVVPTLVDHRGDVSATGKQAGPFRGRNYAGPRDATYIDLQRPFYGSKK